MTVHHKHQDQMGAGLTQDLWKNFPKDEILTFRDLNSGFGVYPNLASFDVAVDAAAATVLYGSDGARGYIDSSSTIAQLTHAEGGVTGGIRLFATADNEETWMQWGGALGSPFVISDTAAELRDMVFEVAFRVANITTAKYGFFTGLMEEGSASADTIADDGTLADKDYFGFFKPEGNTSGIDIVYRKSGQTAVEHVGDWKTIAANTWYHMGFKWDSLAKTITPWFGTGDRSTTIMAMDRTNRVIGSDISDTTDIFPDSEGMAPIVGLKNAHADDAYLDIRLLACGQVAPAPV